MKAITGLFNLNGKPVEHVVIESMIDNVANWPCKEKTLQLQDCVGFGLRRRYSIQSANKCEFTTNGKSNILITADARIDNRDDIINKLSLSNSEGRNLSDSDLIVATYKKWGEDCPNYLIGDFAFAIWDVLQKKLFCARDPMGVMPFFYFYSHSNFVFASSIGAILKVTNVPKKLNELRVAYYLTRIYNDPVITMYEDINRLPAGHCLSLKNGKLRKWSYWELNPEREIRLGSDEEYEEAMRELFFEAVRCRLISNHSVGSMLSGGLDSSSIVCTARQILQQNGGKPIHTYSAIFPDTAKIRPSIDENRYIQSVQCLPGIVGHKVIADQITPLLDIIWDSPEPIPAPNLYIEWLVFKLAQEHGVRVLFSGHDGDTTVSYGYELFADLLRKGNFINLFRETRDACQVQGWPFWGIIRRLAIRPLIPDSLIKGWRFIRKKSEPLKYKGIKLNPEFSKRISFTDRLDELERSEYLGTSARQVHISHIKGGMLTNMNDILRVLADAFDLELRFPYFDRRLIEFCAALPVDQKMHNGESRSIMRRAMKNVLPPMIRSRFSKGNLSHNFNKKMFEHGKELIEHFSSNHFKHIANFVDADDMKNNIKQFLGDPLNSNEEAFNVFLILTLCQWMEGPYINT